MRYSAFILVALLSSKAKSQDLKLAGVEYFNYSKVRIKEGQNNLMSSFQEFGTYANYPTALKNGKTILVNGLVYANVQSTLDQKVTGSSAGHDFHKIAYNFMIIHRWADAWSFVGRLSPTLASDFESNLSGQDFMLQGSVSVTRKLGEYARIGGGILYTTRLGKPMLLPGFHYRYHRGKQLLNAYIPALVNYSYQLDQQQRLHAGLRMAIDGANFNVCSKQLNTGPAVDRLLYFRANAGPAVSYKITRLLQIEATGGLSTFRKYQFEDTAGQNYKYNSEMGAFFNIGIAVVPAKKKENPTIQD
ncbi:MAG: hypothetical protein BGO21_02375 [Dyadobacter sp. 50-39]|uniref:DUF6268 family outer membrane beta-barrel protein n=1 Tax=Dyadobacter sp. 50-39 TaxID=1895756 RepID=UPI000965F92E|nr:DUF6268 family outer membrane beta-barrel protein [Dyadobacter sp. 50-39]OJV12611.1 MAG: hypothetical protein BGO21_02375 [Dyadobacter sp. 50-39]